LSGPSADHFRPLAPGDGDLLAALHRACFAEEMSPDAARLLLGVPATWGLLAYSEDDAGPKPVGFCLVRGVRQEPEILNIGILPDLRGRGLGRSRLRAVLKEVRRRGAGRLFLEVADDNPAGQRLYAAEGFVTVGRRPGYYRRSPNGRVDALLMCLDFTTYTLTGESK